MSSLLNGLLGMPPAVAYPLIFLLVFGEAAIFVGFVLPGETAVVLGGVLAARHDLSLPALMVLVVVSAIAGDSVGYEVGRHFGARLLRWRALHRHRHRIDGARAYLRERGGYAVFLARWTAFLRAVMPGLSGLSRMPYRRFLLYNALGGLAWGVTFSLVGYLAGNSYQAVERQIGTLGALVTAAVVLVLLGIWLVRRHRRGRAAEQDPPAAAEPTATRQAGGD